ncbi:amino acid ABC transporter permease [Pseudobacteriovorax antillogorgiicola]|uniref:amino acid ABC transporter permease n=1 Tax=Pseudobacteriovorax antillogorgiicola TaxID=1513793 RepID=UPI001F3AC264|nr:amino acid ABC transporter permease [Pseudobacteriovorax antillogorgiicola]
MGSAIGFLVYSFWNLDYDWEFGFLWDYIWLSESGKPGIILQGLWGTIYISVISIVMGSIMGVLLGLALLSQEPVTRRVAVFYVDVFRNTPVLVQLYVIYFIVGTALELEPETAGVLTLSLFCSAYVGDIFRGTIQEFEKGQVDAAKSMGLTSIQIAGSVIAPQALRRMLPPLVGQFVSLVKDSSLVSVISVADLTKSALNVVSVSFRSFETWFVVAVIYFALNYILSSYGRYLERKLRVA